MELTSSTIGSKGEKKAVSIIEQVLSSSESHIECLLCRAAFFERSSKYADAIECYNNVIVYFPWFLPALSEKARLLMTMQHWEEVYLLFCL